MCGLSLESVDFYNVCSWFWTFHLSSVFLQNFASLNVWNVSFWHIILCLYVINSAAWAWLLLCQVYKSAEREVHAKSVGSREVPETCTEKWIISLGVLRSHMKMYTYSSLSLITLCYAGEYTREIRSDKILLRISPIYLSGHW